MRYITILLALALMLLSSCMHEPIHQGNRLDEKKVFQVKKGDTKFHVEQILGTPMVHNVMHPNRVTYFEEYEDKESGKTIRRSVEITYDDALRITQINYSGFEKPKQE